MRDKGSIWTSTASILSCPIFGATISSALDIMSALLDGLLGSIGVSSAEESDVSGGFQSGYDYSGSGEFGSAVDRFDHYGGHSGYGPAEFSLH